MGIVNCDLKPAFAVWLTGLPASGKSTVAALLQTELTARNLNVAVLESDVLRQVFTPRPNYDQAERDTFYRQMVFVATLLTEHGVSVIFDATANLRRYRNEARARIRRFLEVFVDCPVEVCAARDPKQIYRSARDAKGGNVPGIQAPYEPPENPDVVVHGDTEDPKTAAQRVISKLEEKGYLEKLRSRG
jgi:adenylylsulfate kinase